MRWFQRKRMDFIRERLRAGKPINRADLIRRFEISTPQASMDLAKFEKLHPGALKYDKGRKRYVLGVMEGVPANPGRDTTAAAKSLIEAEDEWLREVALRDPSMIRDIAAALLYERT